MVQRIISIAFICLCCQAALSQKPNMVMHRNQAATKDKSGWYFAKSTLGHFSVLVPVPFNDFSVYAKDSLGKDVKTHSIGCRTKDNLEFMVMEAPNKSPNKSLRSLLASFDAFDVKEEKLADREVLSFKAKDASSYVIVKCIRNKKFVYMVQAGAPLASQSALDIIYPTFANSLNLSSEPTK